MKQIDPNGVKTNLGSLQWHSQESQWRSKGVLGSQQLEWSHHQREQQAHDERKDSYEMAGATVYTKADALKAFLPIHLTKEASLDNIQLTQRKTLCMPFGAKMSQGMFQIWMGAIQMINILNVCHKKGLVLNSKKLELWRERVTFFGIEYSAEGMHPDSKKVQGIVDMTPLTDKQQLQSFLGMVNYMGGGFIPNLPDHTTTNSNAQKRCISLGPAS